MGSGADAHEARAEALGCWLAREGVHLLTGGGQGVMSAVSRAFAETEDRRGTVIGVLPGRAGSGGRGAPEGYPNDWVEIPIYTHLPLSSSRGTEPLSRNHLNVLTADVVVALPGGAGTASEVRLALLYGRPLIAWVEDPAEIPGLPAATAVARSLAEVERFVRGILAPEHRAGSG